MVAVSSKERSDARIERVLCPSRISEVVVYARGAVVTRTVEIPASLPSTAVDLVVDAITPLAEPGSFRVEIDGEREALGVVTELEVPEDARTEGELHQAIVHGRRAIAEMESKRARLESRRGAIARAHPALALTKKKSFADPDGRAKNVVTAQAMLGELEKELDEKIVILDREISDRRKELERLHLEASQREGKATARKHHPELRAVIRLAAQDAPIRSLAISYGVAEARWWPTYAVHLTDGARKAELFVEALVAQATFEDWKDVAIALSTADMIRDVRLPELTSLRLGRAQPAKKRGFREPPPDLDQLFSAVDEARRTLIKKTAPIPASLHRLQIAPIEVSKVGRFDDDSSVHAFVDEPSGAPWSAAMQMQTAPSAPAEAPGGSGAVPTGMSLPAQAFNLPPAPPMARRSAGPAAVLGGVIEAAADGIASMAESESRSFRAAEPGAIEPADAWLDFDSLRMGERGRLVRVVRIEIVAELRKQIQVVDITSEKLRDPLRSRGEFDHRYDAQGQAEIPSNGRAHRVSLMRAKAVAKPRFVTVPRKVPDVFREVELINPLDAPLLLGPVDVMLDGALLTTAVLEEPVDRGGSFAVGLGVEERVRVARNARVRESTVGMLSTSTAIDHQVTIELVSGLGHGIAVEVLERIPITDDKTVKVELIEATPPSEKYDQKERGRPIDGGLKWKIAMDPGARRTLSFTYRIELPAKSEIQGGNRRE